MPPAHAFSGQVGAQGASLICYSIAPTWDVFHCHARSSRAVQAIKRWNLQAVKKEGLICAAPAHHGGFCLFHSPLGQNGRSKGGVSSSTISRRERKLPPCHRELADKITDLMGKVADGKASPAQLSALASAAKVALSIYSSGETTMADIEELALLSAEVESLTKAAQQKTENEAEGRSRYPAYCRCCEECDERAEGCQCECGCYDTPGGEDFSCQRTPCPHKATASSS